jgi:acetyl esterase/lipase
MKNRFILFVAIVTLLNSCSKDTSTPKSTERGTIIGVPVLIGTYSTSQISKLLVNIDGSYTKNLHYNYDVDLYKIDYNTIDPEGSPTLASGLVVVPKDLSKSFPLLSYQHGTVLKKTNVASQLKGDIEIGPIFATDGYVVACPDYLGMGDGTKLQPYLHAKSEANAVIDMLRAVRLLSKAKGFHLNNQLFLMGYSQGGHATMAALKMMEEQFSAEFSVTACSPMAGPYDLSETQLNFVLRDSAYPSPGYLPYVLFAYNNIYKMYPDLSSVFVSPYYDEFKVYFGDNPTSELDVVDNLWPSSKIPLVVLNPNFVQSIKQDPKDPFVLALKDNDLYDWAPKSPIHLCHCDSDDQVSYQNSVIAYNSFISKGSANIKLIMPLHGGTHVTCGIPSIMYAMAWFDSLKH